MTPGLRKDIWCHAWPHPFFSLEIATATSKMGCQPDDCILPFKSSSGICVGMYGLAYSLNHPRALHTMNSVNINCSSECQETSDYFAVDIVVTSNVSNISLLLTLFKPPSWKTGSTYSKMYSGCNNNTAANSGLSTWGFKLSRHTKTVLNLPSLSCEIFFLWTWRIVVQCIRKCYITWSKGCRIDCTDPRISKQDVTCQDISAFRGRWTDDLRIHVKGQWSYFPAPLLYFSTCYKSFTDHCYLRISKQAFTCQDISTFRRWWTDDLRIHVKGQWSNVFYSFTSLWVWSLNS